jgi:electron transfer flavoprotein alpha subunit
MKILVFTENWDGKFKKLSYELISYARQLGESVTALNIGNVDDSELKELGKYGAAKVLNASVPFEGLDNNTYSAIVAEAAKSEGADVILLADNMTGKAIAPKIAVKLTAGLVSGVTALPVSTDPFVVTKRAYSAKVFANVKVNSALKVLTLVGNSVEILEDSVDVCIESFTCDAPAATTTIKETNKQTGTILLSDADVVVSGGRGMKSGDNWGGIEELSGILGAATACSRPVSDEDWRPHHEHVGQTGKVIGPTLYIALGISGAIQHLAGVNSSKIIVAVNKDPEAPIFEAADYGIVGDVNKVIPQFIEAAKSLKSE